MGLVGALADPIIKAGSELVEQAFKSVGKETVEKVSKGVGKETMDQWGKVGLLPTELAPQVRHRLTTHLDTYKAVDAPEIEQMFKGMSEGDQKAFGAFGQFTQELEQVGKVNDDITQLKSGTNPQILQDDPLHQLRLQEEARRADLIASGQLKDKPRGQILKGREEAEAFYELNSQELKELGFRYQNKKSKNNPSWGLQSLELQAAQQARRTQNIIDVTDPSVMSRGQAKIKAINEKGLDPHHIIPIHISKKLKDTLSEEEWANLLIADAKRHIYHGNHPKNLVAAVNPSRKLKTTAAEESDLFHRIGQPDIDNPGYHTLETKIKAMDTLQDYHLYRDLMAKQMKTKRQGERLVGELQGKPRTSRQPVFKPN